MHGTRLLWLDASRMTRGAASAARDLVLADEHIFPTLRLAPVPGETGLENVLRQIDALTQRRLPPPAPPAAAPPAYDPALRPRLALPPPKPPVPRASSARRKPRLTRIAVGFGAGAVVVFAMLLSPQARFLGASMGSRSPSLIPHPAAAPPATLRLRKGRGVVIVAMPPASAPALAALEPAAGSPPFTTSAPESGSRKAAAMSRPPAPQLPPRLAAALSPAPTARAAPAVAAVAPAPMTGKSRKQTAPGADLAAPLLLARGNELLAMGDVVSARQFFARAQASGAAAAARALAATYDPLFLREIGAVGVKPDASAAASLYRQAAKAGDAAAARRLARLESATVTPSTSGPAAVPAR